MGVMPDSTIAAPKERIREQLWVRGNTEGRKASHANVEWGGHEEDGAKLQGLLKKKEKKKKKMQEREEWR